MSETGSVRAERAGRRPHRGFRCLFLLLLCMPAADVDAGLCGDSNGDSSIDLGDAVHVLTWLFGAGEAPRCGPPSCIDVNSDDRADVSDAVFTLEWLFLGGDAPDCPPSQPVVHEIGHVSLSFEGSPGSSGEMPVEVYYPATEPGEEAAAAPGRFPLVVFGHAYNHESLDYRYVWEELVPSGYVLALSDRLRDDLLLDVDEFALDLHFVLSRMQEEGEDRDSLLFGRLETASALMGHSAGGGAAFAGAVEALADEALDLRAVVALAPLGVIIAPVLGTRQPVDEAARVDVPVLVLEGAKDCTTPSAIHSGPLFDALPRDGRSDLVTLPLGDHCGFSDQRGPTTAACDLAERMLCNPLFPLINLQGETLGSTEQTRVTRRLLKPWLDGHVKDWTDAVELFEERVRTEDVTWRRR